jgi:hypothetical protein
MFAMVDHQFCHAAINTDVFTGNESRFIRAKEQDHFSNAEMPPLAAV